MDRKRVGRIREQPQGKILSAHGRGQTSVAGGNRSLEPHGGRHCRYFAHRPGGVMSLPARFRSWLRAMTARARLESEMETEFRFHMESYIDDLVRSGVPEAEAVRRSRPGFGRVGY